MIDDRLRGWGILLSIRSDKIYICICSHGGGERTAEKLAFLFSGRFPSTRPLGSVEIRAYLSLWPTASLLSRAFTDIAANLAPRHNQNDGRMTVQNDGGDRVSIMPLCRLEQPR